MVDTNVSVVPSILKERDILIPIKIDVTYNGARFIDSLCWSLYGAVMSPDEFAVRTCLDVNLPNGFIHQIYLQVIRYNIKLFALRLF
jgi:hypothetical protein